MELCIYVEKNNYMQMIFYHAYFFIHQLIMYD